MNIKGVLIPGESNINTVEATKFALKYLSDLHFKTDELTVGDSYQDGDVVVISLPYVDTTIASGYEETVEKLYTDKLVTWIVLLIQDDVLPKGSIILDDFLLKLQEGKQVYVERFTEMTSKKYIPLQTRDMMQIMSACDKVYKDYKKSNL